MPLTENQYQIKRAKVACRNLGSLHDAISTYIHRHQSDKGWDGPCGNAEWTLDFESPEYGSDDYWLRIVWNRWEGCSCHGQEIRHTKIILFSDLEKEM